MGKNWNSSNSGLSTRSAAQLVLPAAFPSRAGDVRERFDTFFSSGRNSAIGIRPRTGESEHSGNRRRVLPPEMYKMPAEKSTGREHVDNREGVLLTELHRTTEGVSTTSTAAEVASMNQCSNCSTTEASRWGTGPDGQRLCTWLTVFSVPSICKLTLSGIGIKCMWSLVSQSGLSCSDCLITFLDPTR